jgi:hypothetical protein
MKITPKQLKRIIGEVRQLVLREWGEKEGPNLSLILRDEPVIAVQETGDEFYPSDYFDVDTMIEEMNDILGTSVSIDTIVIDEDALGMGDVPLSQAYAFVAAGPTN